MSEFHSTIPSFTSLASYAIAAVELNCLARESYEVCGETSNDIFHEMFQKLSSAPIPAELSFLRDAVFTHIAWVRECVLSKKGDQEKVNPEPGIQECLKVSSDPTSINRLEKIQYVYVVQHEQTRKMKIGHTTNLSQRLKGLQLASPVLLSIRYAWEVPGALLVERALHAYFSAQHLTGEWFNLSHEDETRLIAYMKDYRLVDKS